MTDRTLGGRAVLAFFVIAALLLSANFLFVFCLVPHASTTALLVALLAVALVLPRTLNIPLLRGRPARIAVCVLLLLCANLLLGTGESVDVERENTAFVGATIITGHRGEAPITSGVLLVGVDGLIQAVGDARSVPVPAGYRVIDLSGNFLLPGLINAHGHLLMDGREPGEPLDLERFAVPSWVMNALGAFLQTYPGRRLAVWQMEKNVESALYAGVTTLRGLGDPAFGDVEVRDRIKAGQTIGPRILASGPVLCVTGGHANQIGQVIDGPDEARRAVRIALQRHVDQIKIANTGGVSDSRRIGEAGELQMTPEEIEAVVDEAHRKNVLVAAHAESAQGVLEALRAGVDSIEHGAELDDEAIRLFKNNPNSLRGYTTLHPTLSVIAGDVELTAEVRSNPALFVMHSNGNVIKERMLAGFDRAVAEGVTIAVGTDAGIVRHAAVWKEMLYFTLFGGISNEDALHIGTLGTAESIGVADITGSIDVGKFADFLVVESDPIEDLNALAEPVFVVSEGVVYDRR
jgi:imidazolonepropionase-like amidohydrolase